LPTQQTSEIEVLDFGVAVRENSRLPCQIKMTDELDGLAVIVAPESL
jgi:ferredoxin